MFIEMIAPNFPHLFTVLVCMAGVAKVLICNFHIEIIKKFTV